MRLSNRSVLALLFILFATSGCEPPPLGGPGSVCNPVPVAGPQYLPMIPYQFPAVFLSNDEFAINVASSLKKYQTDGSIDPAFAPLANVGSFGFDSDGSVVALSGNACSDPYCAFSLERFEPDGVQDGTFSPQLPDLGSLVNLSETATDGGMLVIQPDGKIVGGSCFYTNSSSQFVLIRWNSDGSLDPSFGNGGVISSPGASSPGDCAVQQMLLNSDGSQSWLVERNDANFSVVTFNATGTEESEASIPWSAPVLVSSPLGALLDETLSNGGFALSLWQPPSGSIDLSFGQQGYVQFSTLWDATHVDLSQPNGEIIVAGLNQSPSPALTLTRYTAVGQLDPTFGSGGQVQVSVAQAVYVNGGTVDSDGTIRVAITNQISPAQQLNEGPCGTYLPPSYGLSVMKFGSSGTPE